MKLKRVYDRVERSDNYRVLVDRIWPRGISKDKAQLNDWLKDIGPSKELRQWFHHDPEKFDEFKEIYIKELENDEEKKAAFEKLQKIHHAHHGKITLIFAAKETTYNHAVVLQELLEKEE